MVKKLLVFTISILFIIIASIIYLSKFGLETNKFNSLIENQLTKYSKDLELDIKKIKIYLKTEDLFNPEIKIQTDNAILKLKNNKIKIASISTYIKLISYFKGNFTLDHIEVETLNNKIEDLIFITAKHLKPQLIILNSFIKQGDFWAKVKINFDKNGNIKKDFKLNGKIINAKVKLLNEIVLENVNLEFEKKKKL